ncbi:unnamed protein product [Anisakis simplex]|uniref:Uncharacterized protein n=1 Tax=Anisakis simplex TaxID=6269 RepID=A0A0M3JI81_ANISI|nr:unnamed protein product [Anisakis simplex]
MMNTHSECRNILEGTNGLFPIEVDLAQIAHKYNTSGRLSEDDEDLDAVEQVNREGGMQQGEDSSKGNIGNGNEQKEENLLDL